MTFIVPNPNYSVAEVALHGVGFAIRNDVTELLTAYFSLEHEKGEGTSRDAYWSQLASNKRNASHGSICKRRYGKSRVEKSWRKGPQ